MPTPCREFSGTVPPIRALLLAMDDGRWWKVSQAEIAESGAADFRASASYHSRAMGRFAEVRKQVDGYMVRLTPR